MSKYMLAFSVMLVTMALVQSAHADTYGSDLRIVLTNQTPYPVEPGSNLDIGIQLQNNGRGNAQNVYMEIDPSSPFELLPGQDIIKFFSQVPALDSARASYKFHVNNSAVTDNYEITFRLYLNGLQDNYFTEAISVNVQGLPDLVISDISTSPSSIEPGSLVDVKAVVKNVGTGSAKNLQMQFNSTVEEIKSVLSRGSVFVGDVMPGEEKEVVFGVSVDSAAEEKTYTLSLTANYKDENNNAVAETFPIGLPVKGSVMLDIVKVEPLADRDMLRIEIANKGTTSAKSIDATLILDNKTIDVNYVSELKATKKTTMDFSPLVNKGVAQLVINYVGPGLEKNQAVKQVSLNFAATGSGGDGYGITIVIVIIAAVVGYYFWRKHGKRKKHGQ